jgi:hypothetical protein
MPETPLQYRPSAADRWLKCPGSLNCPQQCEPTTVAAEGLAAHRLAHRCWLLGLNPGGFVGHLIEEVKVTDEMVQAVQLYLDEIEGTAAELKADRDQIHPECFVRSDVFSEFGGTIDCLIRSDSGIAIIEFSYGHQTVEAANNSQLMCYAILARNLDDEVRLTVVQPRAPHTDGPVRSVTVGPYQLNAFAVQCYAAIARGPEDTFAAGDHCRYCPRRADCPELYDLAVQTAESENSEQFMTPERASEVLARRSAVEGYLQAVEQYAHNRLNQGVNIPGYKLVPRFGQRRYCVDEDTVIRRCRSRRFGRKKVCEKRLLSPTQLEKVVGTDLVDSLVTRPVVGTAVVPASDHRLPVKSVSVADESTQEPSP